MRGRDDEPGPARPEPAVELLLTDTDGWERHGGDRAGLPPAPLWRQAEARMLALRVAELVARWRRAPGRRSSCCCVRPATWRSSSARSSWPGLRTLAAVGAFWGHQQIGDLIAYLRALANPLDEEALYGMLASPLGGCSRDCLALIARAAQDAHRGAWETALAGAYGEGELAEVTPGDRDALAKACALLRAERAGSPLRTIADLIERAIAATGYREHVLALEWGERRLANMHKLLRLARRFEAGEGRDLRAFLDHVECLAVGAALEPDAPVEGVEPDAVRLMSIHAAKGLEFPVVCVADLGRKPQHADARPARRRRARRAAPGAPGRGRSSGRLDYEELCAERRRREARGGGTRSPTWR